MSFRITIEPSGRQFDVLRDEPILAAAIRAGVGMPYGCRDGACGSCKSRLKQGRVIHGAHQQKALSAQEEDAGLVLPCCATPQTDCVLESRAVVGADEYPVLKMPSRVMSLERAAPDVMVLRLQLPSNQAFKYHAGQAVEFLLRDGQRRSYCIAHAPTRMGNPPLIELHIRLASGGLFSDSVFGSLKERDILRLEGPFGRFRLADDPGVPLLLLAQGIGFAPVQALLQQLRDSGQARPTRLYWGGATRADLYRHDGVVQQATELPWLSYVPVLTHPAADADWRGRTGNLAQAVLTDLPQLQDHQAYAAGPANFVDELRQALLGQAGLAADAWFGEPFVAALDIPKSNPQAA